MRILVNPNLQDLGCRYDSRYYHIYNPNLSPTENLNDVWRKIWVSLQSSTKIPQSAELYAERHFPTNTDVIPLLAGWLRDTQSSMRQCWDESKVKFIPKEALLVPPTSSRVQLNHATLCDWHCAAVTPAQNTAQTVWRPGVWQQQQDTHYVGLVIYQTNRVFFFRVVSGVCLNEIVPVSRQYWFEQGVYDERMPNRSSSVESIHKDCRQGTECYRTCVTPFGFSLDVLEDIEGHQEYKYIGRNQHLYFTFPELFIPPFSSDDYVAISSIDTQILGLVDHIKNANPTCLASWMALSDKMNDMEGDWDNKGSAEVTKRICGWDSSSLSKAVVTAKMLKEPTKANIANFEIYSTQTTIAHD